MTVDVEFLPGALPENYITLVDPAQAVFASVSSKTTSGFTVTLTPPSDAAVAAGTFNVFVFG